MEPSFCEAACREEGSKDHEPCDSVVDDGSAFRGKGDKSDGAGRNQCKDDMADDEGFGNVPCLFNPRKISGRKNGKRREHRKDVGEELRGRYGEEKENEKRPYDEVEHDLVFSPFTEALQKPRKSSAPWIEACQHDDDVEPVMVLPCVLRSHEARDIMVAQKCIDESISVEHAHFNVPGKSDEAGKRDAPVPFKSHDVLDVKLARKNEPETDNQGRESESNRPLRQKCKAARDIRSCVFLSQE